jgi:hypothetical protein
MARGTSEIHSPGIAMQVLEVCAWGIDPIFLQQANVDGAPAAEA